MTVLEEKKSGATGATPERHGSDIGSDRSDMGATWERHWGDTGVGIDTITTKSSMTHPKSYEIYIIYI